MAIKKQIRYEIVCEGPCKQRATVEKIPPSWSRLKIEDAVQVVGQPQTYRVATLCNTCRQCAERILREAGYTLQTVNGGR